MNQTNKFLFYGTGFLLGCIFVYFMFYREVLEEKEAEKAEVQSLPLPWRGALLYHEKLEEYPDGTYRRVRIIDDGSDMSPVRLIETVRMDDRSRETILTRSVMDPYTVVVLLQPGVTEAQLRTMLAEHHLVVKGARPRAGVFEVDVRGLNVLDPVPAALKLLKPMKAVFQTVQPDMIWYIDAPL